jgi:predicted  nucleic acid-binding Zn-ribbon protein
MRLLDEQQIAPLDGQIASLDGQIASLDGQIASLDGQIASLDGQIASLGGQIKAVDDNIVEVEQNLWDIETQLNDPATDATLRAHLEAKKKSLEKRQGFQEKRLESLRADKKSLQNIQESLRDDKKSLRDDKKPLQKKLELLQQKQGPLLDTRADLQNSVRALRGAMFQQGLEQTVSAAMQLSSAKHVSFNGTLIAPNTAGAPSDYAQNASNIEKYASLNCPLKPYWTSVGCPPVPPSLVCHAFRLFLDPEVQCDIDNADFYNLALGLMEAASKLGNETTVGADVKSALVTALGTENLKSGQSVASGRAATPDAVVRVDFTSRYKPP